MNSINHPILPQLDYSFLSITVANPAINRSTKNEVKSAHSIVFNGFTPVPSNSVPLHVKPLNDAATSKQPNNAFLSTPLNVESLKNNLPTLAPPNPRKSDMDVSFAIPERNKLDMGLNFASKASVSELDVDFPIPPIRMDPKFAPSRTSVSVIEPRKVDFDARFKNSINSNFLNANSLTNSLEPRSLDLPEFHEPAAPPDDDFSDFQSATIPTIDEYSDFQSASPMVKYELHSAAEKLQSSSDSTTPSVLRVEPKEWNFVKDDPSDHKTSTEADKYDVFRALMEPSKEDKAQPPVDSSDDDEDEEFGDFFTADVKPNEVKRELSIKVIFWWNSDFERVGNTFWHLK